MSAPMCFCNRRLASGTMADGPQWDSGARNCGSGRVAVTIHAQELLRLRLSCTAGTTQATEPRYEAADVDRFPAPSRDDLKGREPYLASYCFRYALQVHAN